MKQNSQPQSKVSEIKIHESTDYEKFKYVPTNRDVKSKRVKNLQESISQLDLTGNNPIVVNENFEIIDGQGRFEACRDWGMTIYYTIANLNGNSDLAMQLMNANKSNWTLKDYVDHYVKLNVPAYLAVKECMDMYHVTASCAVCFVANSANFNSDIVKHGKLKQGKIAFEVFGNILNDYKPIFKNYNHVYFVRALVYVIKFGYYKHSVDFDRMVKRRSLLLGCANTEGYLHMFEDILNSYRRGDKLSILKDYPRIDKTDKVIESDSEEIKQIKIRLSTEDTEELKKLQQRYPKKKIPELIGKLKSRKQQLQGAE